MDKPLNVKVVDKEGKTKPGATKTMNRMNLLSKKADDFVKRRLGGKPYSGEAKIGGDDDVGRVVRATLKSNTKANKARRGKARK